MSSAATVDHGLIECIEFDAARLAYDVDGGVTRSAPTIWRGGPMTATQL